MAYWRPLNTRRKRDDQLAVGRHHALLHHGKLRGQRACAQLHREMLGVRDCEIAAHLPEPPRKAPCRLMARLHRETTYRLAPLDPPVSNANAFTISSGCAGLRKIGAPRTVVTSSGG